MVCDTRPFRRLYGNQLRSFHNRPNANAWWLTDSACLAKRPHILRRILLSALILLGVLWVVLSEWLATNLAFSR